jgi:hypothetical protein
VTVSRVYQTVDLGEPPRCLARLAALLDDEDEEEPQKKNQPPLS